MIILPETPRYLIKKGDNAAAAKSLSRLRRLAVDHPALVEELAEIQANHEYEMSIGSASYLACYRKPVRVRQLTGICLQGLQQVCHRQRFLCYAMLTNIVYRYQFHLLLRYFLLRELWHRQPVHRKLDYRHCQRGQHNPRFVAC